MRLKLLLCPTVTSFKRSYIQFISSNTTFITSLLYEKNIDMLEVADVVGKIRSHEMFLMGEFKPPQAKKNLALKAKSDHKSKKNNKCKAPPSSSSDDEASDDSNNEDGHEIWSLLFS